MKTIGDDAMFKENTPFRYDYVSSDKKVVPGLITTKLPKLESKERVITRIHEAAKCVLFSYIKETKQKWQRKRTSIRDMVSQHRRFIRELITMREPVL